MFELRPATATDAEAIHALHSRSVHKLCSAHYDSAIIDAWLKERTAGGYLPGIAAGATFVVTDADRIVGFCEAVLGEVLAVFVDADSTSRGIGAMLLERAIARAAADGRTIRLESTLNAVRFYERYGFTTIRPSAVRRNDVDIPVVVMERRGP